MPFQPGNSGFGGRPKGAKNKIVKSEHTTILQLLEQLRTDNPDLFKETWLNGLKAQPPRSYPYLALAHKYLDGEPSQQGSTQTVVILGLAGQQGLPKQVLQLQTIDVQAVNVDTPAMPAQSTALVLSGESPAHNSTSTEPLTVTDSSRET